MRPETDEEEARREKAEAEAAVHREAYERHQFETLSKKFGTNKEQP
jgi:hypothetical protein